MGALNTILDVEICLSKNIYIDYGDDVTIAGKMQRGVFRGLAYRNDTNGIKGKDSTTIMASFIAGPALIGSTFIGVFSPLIAFYYSSGLDDPMLLPLGIFFLALCSILWPLGIWLIRKAVLCQMAYRRIS